MKNILSFIVFIAATCLMAQDVQVRPWEFNSSSDDFAPAQAHNGRQFYFTSDRRGGKQRVFEITRNADGMYELAGMTEGEINDAKQAGSVTLTPDGNYMVFAAYEHESRSEGRTDLYSARRVKGEWTEITNLGPTVNSDSWDSQPSITSDGSTLYFASDRPGGQGGTDIYVAYRTREGWTRAQNLGSAVNSMYDDMSPIISADNKTFSFASNRGGGFGGFDIYFTRLSGTSFAAPRNAGEPINSSSDEYFYVPLQNTNVAYFSSDRPGGDGALDVYTAVPNPNEPEAVVYVTGVVSDAETREPLGSVVTITDLKSNKKIASFNSDDETGEYYVVLIPGRTYSITSTRPGYLFYSERFEIPANEKGREIRKDIELSKNVTRLLVFFDFDKSELKDESIPELERIADFLRDRASVAVLLEGHTDDVGDADYNMKLSRDRAASVKKWLSDHGIEASRIETKGYGESQPLVRETTEEARATNRRVEMKITKF